MSYSRWGDSDWYIFWCSSSAISKGKQLLAIWHSIDDTPHFTYDELVKMKGNYNKIPGYKESSYRERRTVDNAIEDFIHDVDAEFPEEKSKVWWLSWLRKIWRFFFVLETGRDD